MKWYSLLRINPCSKFSALLACSGVPDIRTTFSKMSGLSSASVTVAPEICFRKKKLECNRRVMIVRLLVLNKIQDTSHLAYLSKLATSSHGEACNSTVWYDNF